MPVLTRYGLSANKLFDYLLASRPTIFACRSLNDPVAEARAGLSVPPEDPGALARAALTLSELPAAEARAMGVRGRDWVLEHHDLNKLALRLVDVVGAVVRTKKTRRPRRGGGS